MQSELGLLWDSPAKEGREKRASAMRVTFPRRSITEKDKADFCTQLSVMLQAKVSIVRALEVLIKQTEHRSIHSVIVDLAAEIRKGKPFDKVLEKHPEVFNQLFVATVEVGQESGRLPEVLSHLALHLEKMNGLKRKILQALAYPGLVLGVAAIAVTFLLLFIVPTFAEMFKSFQVDLPFSTRLIMRISALVRIYGAWAILAVAIAGYLARQSFASPIVRSKTEDLLLRLPFVGRILVKTHVARFCRTLGTLLRSQVSLVDALTVTQRIVAGNLMRSEIGSIIRHVRRGTAMVTPIEDSKVFPPMVVQMIAVGEETSELDAMLLKVADYYEKDIDGMVETLSSIIEPVLVLILGIFVAVILVSMYLPMFDLVNVVGGG